MRCQPVYSILLLLMLKVGCDGVLGSTVRLDKCGVCGGDNTSCHIISGIFTRQSLSYGYNKVATIAKGACRINITEMYPSSNYLALKIRHGKHVINTNWKLSPSGDYVAAGTVFKYHRPLPGDSTTDQEYIIAQGPTNHSIEIMVLASSRSTSEQADGRSSSGSLPKVLKKDIQNRGIIYEYTIPMGKETKTSTSQTVQTLAGTSSNQLKPIKPATGEVEETDAKAVTETDIIADQANPYKVVGNDFTDYVLGNTKSGTYPTDTTGTGQSGGTNANIYTRTHSSSTDTAYKNPVSNPHYTSSSGHRYRHNGRHGRNKLILSEAPQYIPPQRYDYQALTNSQVPNNRNSLTPGGTPYLGSYNGGQGTQTVYNSVSQLKPLSYGSQHGVQSPLPIASSQTRGGYPNPSYPKSQVPQRFVYAGQGGSLTPMGQGSMQPAAYPGQSRIYRPTSNTQGRTHYGASQYPSQGVGRGQPYSGQTYPSYLQTGSSGPSYVQNSYASYGTQGGYQGGYNPQDSRGQIIPARGTVNDQIALSLPNGQNRLQIGNVNPSTTDFTWKISGFTNCTRTCGGGVQSTVIVCVKGSNQVVVTDENCDNALKPHLQNVSCNNRPCHPGWNVEEWGPCSTTCDRGTQSRIVDCKQRISNTITISVSASLCRLHPKPDHIQVCNEDRPCIQWKIGEWGKCSVECGRGQRSREVFCVNAEGSAIAENVCKEPRPRPTEICDMGSCVKTWFYTEWSDECSSDCGEGVYTRGSFCTAEPDKCAASQKPREQKSCHNDMPCGGKWFTGPWSKCTVTCGTGVSKRSVACLKKFGALMAIVGEENCQEADKPETELQCERPACQDRWYMTDWSECSKTCGTGWRTREVKCLNRRQQPSLECLREDRPEIRQTCNTMSCPAKTLGSKNGGTNLDQTARDPGCKDRYRDCRLVVQARLCQYDYYKNICCFSCSSDHHHGDDHT